jgi:hypothetical protein
VHGEAGFGAEPVAFAVSATIFAVVRPPDPFPSSGWWVRLAKRIAVARVASSARCAVCGCGSRRVRARGRPQPAHRPQVGDKPDVRSWPACRVLRALAAVSTRARCAGVVPPGLDLLGWPAPFVDQDLVDADVAQGGVGIGGLSGVDLIDDALDCIDQIVAPGTDHQPRRHRRRPASPGRRAVPTPLNGASCPQGTSPQHPEACRHAGSPP